MSQQVVVVRHAETEWSREGRLTGVTDIPLTVAGEVQAKSLGGVLAGRQWQQVLVSPMARTRRTAELLGAGDQEICDELRPWDYGDDERGVIATLLGSRPGWSLFRDGPVHGEPPDSVTRRVDRIVARCQEWLVTGDVLVVSHSHVLQLFAARWLGLAPHQGECFDLDTAAIGVLATSRGVPRIVRWNVEVGSLT